LNSTLKGTAAAGAAAPRNRLLSGLVVVEVAMALVLLAGGGLLMKSFVSLLRVDLGIRSDHLLTFEIGLSGSKYGSENRRSAFFEDLMARMRGLPGVSSAAAVDALPMGGYFSGGGFTIEGRPAPGFWRDMAAQYCSATPAYFRTMGIPVLLGREFDERDRDGAPVAIVSQALARRFFPNQNPLGHRINEGRTIVGVIGDVRHGGPARDSELQIYYPFPRKGDRGASVALRTAGDPLRLAQLVRGEVRALDPSLPVDKIRSMEQVVADSLAEPRLATSLMGGFAMFALLLVAIGLYGVVAYSVSQRRHEISVRLALGAGYANVLGLVLRQGALLSVMGTALGTPVALAASRLLRSLLHGTQPTDASVFAAVSLLLVLVALAASFVPAHGAARLNAVAALREE
jgi:putative ABC transport system permease protein